MEKIERFKGRKVTVVGLARSGLACARLLLSLGAKVKLTENADSRALADLARRLISEGAQVELGRHSEDFIKEADLVVVSPGVTDKALPLVWARAAGIPVIGEVELAWQVCPASVIAITGTNGKTTVTELIGRVINASGRKAHVCGNIGNPFSGEIEKMREGDLVSLEISSFQLETIKTFKPHIALILNFTSDHLNRYRDMQEYLQAKKRVFMNQDENDYLLLSSFDPALKKAGAGACSRVAYFDDKKTGDFNANQLAVMAVADILGISRDITLQVLREFKGLEHRLEYVTRIKGIDFINDSKSTNVEATAWALNNLKQPLILIAGGSDKGLDYGAMKDIMRGRVKNLILIGQTRQKIASDIKGAVPVEEAATLPDAVRRAYGCASSGDCVILSPMCASFDMFKDYEHRGRIFKEEVEKLKNAA
ncbi:MAG: Mur ligase family protein [Candidatus Omnitrophica bacterium]|nr:Mur ligase family protein [Candidatus Omnitrophota bacterium]